jgi:hypothetical protein
VQQDWGGDPAVRRIPQRGRILLRAVIILQMWWRVIQEAGNWLPDQFSAILSQL